ncbi:lysozyme inhibitor LprI family protein [Chromobacterium sphagni]|uniref:Lysozyme inhibitor LprI-like N-terminal domain-containing protein n=1 Tax=Chromobacterium sphagni TaxID=1903179 RepID=A0ABX3CBX3_9NEIS|nr:lysozyme inhibitor LprI family protein [Chromobacterium sphagni]OHX19719.1 hypothetical protein BI344_08780 [Chromobacterium sphagni]
MPGRLTLTLALLASPAWAGALDDCSRTQADTQAIASCLKQRHADIHQQLIAQEDKTLAAMRQLDRATDNRFHAARALRRAQQTYQAYLQQQCDWLAASHASGNGADRARLACEIDLDTQRLADLARQGT